MGNNRTRAIVYIGGGILAVLVLALALRGIIGKQAPVIHNAVQYTNPTTGQQSTDIPAQADGSDTGTLGSAGVRIAGIESIYNYLTNPQGLNTQTAINNFLMARSGLADVQSGIRNNHITQVNSQTVRFTIDVVRPQVSYEVTVYVANQLQAVPNVTFKRVQ